MVLLTPMAMSSSSWRCPVGFGYSVEAQLTGDDNIGKMQFEITPAKPLSASTEPGFDISSYYQILQRAACNNGQISVKNLQGQTITLSFDADMLAGHITHLIQYTEGISIDEQRLVFVGKQLQPDGEWV